MAIRSVSRRRTRPVLGPLALLWTASRFLVAQAAPPSAPAVEPVLLEAGSPITRSISGGQTHSYRVRLEAGRFLDLVVEQLGADVGLTFTAPDGTKLAELDSPNGLFGPEPLCWLAPAAGDFRLDVAVGAPKAPEGKYRITIRAVRTPDSSDRSRARAQALVFEGEGLRGQGAAEAVEKAVPLYDEAARLYREADDVAGEARALFFLASSKDFLGLTPENAAWLGKALLLAPRLGDPGFEAALRTWLGLATHHLGDPTAALAMLDRAIEIEEGTGDGSLLGFTHGCRGQVCMFIGDHEGAARSLARARELMAIYGDRRSEAVILNDMALNASDVGETDEALRGYERAIVIEQEIGDKNDEAISRNNLGLVYGTLGEWGKALEQHELALPLRRAVGTRYGEAYTLTNLGIAHGKLGAIDQAQAELAAALDLRRQVGDRHGEAVTLQALGTLRLEANRAAEAVPDFERALEIRRAIADLDGQAKTLASLALAARSLGQPESALRRAEEAVAVVESRRHLVEKSLRPTYLGSARTYYELEIDLLMAAGHAAGSSNVVRAFETSERAKARSLIELLAESRANIRQGVDAALVARELSVRRRLGSKLEQQTRMLAGRHTDAQASEAAAGIEVLIGELRDVEDAIRKASPRYAALTSAEPLGLRSVQDLLDADTVVLAYSLGDERSFLWAVERDRIAAWPLPGRARIESAARRAYESWRQRPSSSARRSAASSGDLGAMLLPPDAGRWAGKRIAIVPDGVLAFLPFGVLAVPDTGGRLLSADHEIVVLPSASTLAFLRAGPARATPSMTLAVVADPVFERDDPRIARHGGHPGPVGKASRSRAAVERSMRDADAGGDFRLERLPFTRREAQAILALVPAASRRSSLDFEADRERALEDLSSYRFIHFATHAFSNALHPELSGLVLSLVDREGRDREGFVPASEVFNLNLSADLVVLSACRTALGKEVRGEGLLGLARAFMYAGAPRVVASLWRVDDAATAELMARFYKGMLGPEKLRPAAALREAQGYVRSQSRWEDPYYWAGFVLQGDWR